MKGRKTMNLMPLEDVAEIIMGQSPPSSTYNSEGRGLPFFQGKVDFGDLYPRNRVFCSAPQKVAEKGDILISVRAPVGPTNVSRDRSAIGRGLAALRCRSNLDPRWLLYFLRFYEPELAGIGKGSTFEAISRSDLEDVRVPLPPLPEQQRIAAILARADHLRRLRRYALALSEGYLQAVFVEMFGDQLQERHSRKQLGDLVAITGGGTPSRAISRYYEGTIPWLTSKDMRGDYIYDTQEHVTREAIDSSATKLVPVGSLLVVVKSKVLMHRLPVAMTRVLLCHGQDIKSIQCSSKIDPFFALYVLRHSEPQLLAQARGANTEGLTLPMLHEVPVPDVSLVRQRQFAQIIQRFDRVRAQQREAARQAEQLFGALLRRAFQGEV